MTRETFYFIVFLSLLAGFGIGMILFGPQHATRETPPSNPVSPGVSMENSSTAVPPQPPDTQSPPENPDKDLTEQAWVQRVIDGDTIEVLVNGKEEKVRLLGIDTPETVDPRRPVQCYGKE